MTTRIVRAQVSELRDFDAHVAFMCKELAQHDAHMALVTQGKATPYPAPEGHPLVMSAIKKIGDGSYQPDYELVENPSPKDDEELRSVKNHLLNSVATAEATAITNVMPLGRRRLFDLRHSEVISGDRDRHTKIASEDHAAHLDVVKDNEGVYRNWVSKNLEKSKQWNELLASDEWKALSAEERAKTQIPVYDPMPEFKKFAPKSHDQIAVEAQSGRTPEDVAYMARHKQIVDRTTAIHRHSAEMMDEVENLTVDNIHNWQMKPFPTE